LALTYYPDDNIIIVERDTSGDDIAYCGNNCMTLFGSRIKLKLSKGFLHCPECATHTEVNVSLDGYSRRFQVKNEVDAKNIMIISRRKQRLPNSILSRDTDEEAELKQLREMYRRT
jgi:hypothetical protein